jgi:hypothetical protein
MTKIVNLGLTNFVQKCRGKIPQDRISVNLNRKVAGGQWSVVSKREEPTTDH